MRVSPCRHRFDLCRSARWSFEVTGTRRTFRAGSAMSGAASFTSASRVVGGVGRLVTLAARAGAITQLRYRNGRASLPWHERIELDVWYVDRRSLWLDVKILAMTGRMLITGHGLYKGETGGWQGPM